MLGGPGSGKGTICDHLIKTHKFIHISCGDLIRQFMKNNPTHETTLRYIKIFQDGNTIPPEDSFKFMQEFTNDFYKDITDKQLNIVIDGYPRTLPELMVYNQYSSRPFTPESYQNMYLIHVNTPDHLMMDRIFMRARDFADNDIEIVKKRINHYHTRVMPVVDYIVNNMSTQYLEVSGKDDPENNAKLIVDFISS